MDDEEARSEALRGATSLVTGFPGFLTSHILVELAARQDPGARFVLLVLPDQREAAARRLEGLDEAHPGLGLQQRCALVEGDITRPDLGLGQQPYETLRHEVGVVWHLAALYDLAVEEEVARRVNVTGTIHVLDFCELCPDLLRLNYVSTCYVSGDREGAILEDELDEGQGHKNHYESTKFWAELEVQRRAARCDLEVVILRPGIIVGDSYTGATEKFDGPYFVFRLLERLPTWLPIPNVGRGEAPVNLVPIDFASRAMAHIALSSTSATPGHPGVYQIADPRPMLARDVLALAADLLGHRRLHGLSLPPWLAEAALQSEAVSHALELPAEALAYFDHDARYDSSATQRALATSDIRCPHLSSYLDRLLAYMRGSGAVA